MKKLLIIGLLLASTAWAQDQSQAHVKLDMSDGVGAPEENTSFLPFTMDITHIISPNQFEKLSVADLRAGIFKYTLNLMDEDKESMSVSGTLFNFRQKKVFLNGQNSKTFRGMEILGLEVKGAFKLKDKVYLQLQGHYRFGTSDASTFRPFYTNTDLYGVNDECTQEFYNHIGANNEVPWSDAASGLYQEFGGEAKLTIRKLDISLFGNKIMGKYGRANYYNSPSLDDHYMYSHVKMSDVGLKLQYKLAEMPRIGDVSLFVGYTLSNFKRDYTGKSDIYTDDGVQKGYKKLVAENKYSKQDLAGLSGVQNKTQGVLNVGVKVDLFRKKK